MVVTMRPNPRNKPIWTITSTTENTMPTRVAMKRSRSWNRLREASVRVSDMERSVRLARLVGDGALAWCAGLPQQRSQACACGPAHRQCAGKNNHALTDGTESLAEQRILQPDHEDIVQQIDAV